eukprot:CAMPEP_0197182972 /NCGR_PEP_ID=MMETSP1423-20130617/7178_1 /TAXON_ID=476441 /ORGANISM="Pseudo-nitzschia heimii, Strain UNC1101" /LENGTH=120 /DNA_ID=CAMNT_0042633487 /DNA_START=20 /DNA_END=382 /DNA_ORIENTATION=+
MNRQYATSPGSRKVNGSPHYTASRNVGESRYGNDVKRVSPPFPRGKASGQEGQHKMFDLFDTKAEVEILNSAEDDMLAASMYGGVKKSKRKKSTKKNKKGVSGYNFDAIIGDESSSSGDL